jgi:hypothetical protein
VWWWARTRVSARRRSAYSLTVRSWKEKLVGRTGIAVDARQAVSQDHALYLLGSERNEQVDPLGEISMSRTEGSSPSMSRRSLPREG